MLLNYHIGRFVLGSLCVGYFVQLGLSSVRVVRFSIDFVVFLVATSRARQEVGKHFKIRKSKQLTVLTQRRLQLQL